MKNKLICTLLVGALIFGMFTVTGLSSSSDRKIFCKGWKNGAELFSSKAENKDILQKLVDKFVELMKT